MGKKIRRIARNLHDSFQSSKLVRVLVLSAVCAIFSAYFSLAASCIFSGEGGSYNPIRLIEYCSRHGFPSSIFTVLMFVLEPLVIFAVLIRKDVGTPDSARNFSYSDKEDYGSLRLMTDSEVKKCDAVTVKDVVDTDGIIVGQLDENAEDTVAFDIHNGRQNRHMLVFGASMCGKTFSFVKPFLAQCCKRRESVIMSDPKGELFEETSEYFRNFGYTIKVINFKDFQHSDGWNLMNELGPRDNATQAQIRAQLFANTVISNAMPNASGLFRDGPLSLFKALLLRIHLDPTMEDTIETLYNILSDPRGKDYLDELFDESSLQGDLQCCLGPYATFKSGSANLSGNILSGLAAAINPFQIGDVRKITSDPDGIDLTLPGKKPCAYYFLFPDQNEDYKFLIALLFTFVFNDLVDYADNQPGRKCEVPVNILLEEAKSVGIIPLFATRLSNIRSRNVFITTIFQDLAQVKFLYPDEWLSILNNCSTRLGLGFNDDETAELFSTRAGEATIVASTEKHQGIETVADMIATSVGSGTRAVFTSAELQTIDRDECIVIFQGKHIIKCRKFPITLHPDFEMMDAKHVKATDIIPSINDPEARKRYNEENEKRVQEYEEWLKQGNEPIHGKKVEHEGTQANNSNALGLGELASKMKEKVISKINSPKVDILDPNTVLNNLRKPDDAATGAYDIPFVTLDADGKIEENENIAEAIGLDDLDDFDELDDFDFDVAEVDVPEDEKIEPEPKKVPTEPVMKQPEQPTATAHQQPSTSKQNKIDKNPPDDKANEAQKPQQASKPQNDIIKQQQTLKKIRPKGKSTQHKNKKYDENSKYQNNQSSFGTEDESDIGSEEAFF